MLPVLFSRVIRGNQYIGTISYGVICVLPACYPFEKTLNQDSWLLKISAPVKMSSEKHLAQLSKFFSFLMGMSALNFTSFHRAAIMAFSPSFSNKLHHFNTHCKKICISPDNIIS